LIQSPPLPPSVNTLPSRLLRCLMARRVCVSSTKFLSDFPQGRSSFLFLCGAWYIETFRPAITLWIFSGSFFQIEYCDRGFGLCSLSLLRLLFFARLCLCSLDQFQRMATCLAAVPPCVSIRPYGLVSPLALWFSPRWTSRFTLFPVVRFPLQRPLFF